MSTDSFTEVTSQGWLSRIGNSIKGILFGLVLILGAIIILFWNEGRTIERMLSLEEGSAAVIEINANAVLAGNNGKLVHLTHMLSATDLLYDTEFNVQVHGLRLQRKVQMYQWVEKTQATTKKEVGGSETTTTQYSYEKEWMSYLVVSNSFKKPLGHENINTNMFIKKDIIAQDARVGDLGVTNYMIEDLSSLERFVLDINQTLPIITDKNIVFNNGEFYVGQNPSIPELGDQKVSYFILREHLVSIVAEQSGPYLSKYETAAGGTISIISKGAVSAKVMFKQAQDKNNLMKWIFRAAGVAMMIFGLYLIMAPLTVVADVLPFLGNLARAGTGSIAFLLGSMLSLIIISIAWIYYRPLIALALLTVAAVLAWLVKFKIKKV